MKNIKQEPENPNGGHGYNTQYSKKDKSIFPYVLIGIAVIVAIVIYFNFK